MQISGILERVRQCEGPFVLVGDLNASPGSPELGPMLAAEIFRSCEGLVCTHRFMRRQIDYVFADPGWATTTSRVLRIGPSDHWPVLVDLRRDPRA